jgi:hypothetical protein
MGPRELNDIKRILQDHLRPGIVVVIGSGLSCAEGLPSMRDLADHLAAVDLAEARVPIDAATWSEFIKNIKAKGLEGGLKQMILADEVVDFIRRETAVCVRVAEDAVVREVFMTRRRLRFSALLPHLPQDDRFVVITTNYDRLIELAAETAGFQVDTKSLGSYFARFSRTEGAFAFVQNVLRLNNCLRKVERRVISLYKPHGSLDWVDYYGQPIRLGFDVGPERSLIVTPGRDKYRACYDEPFDMHRELANDAIDRADRLLIIGYGFNDDHLETHLKTRIRSGRQTVMLARTLTENAKANLAVGSSVWGIEETFGGTNIYNNGKIHEVMGEHLWDVEEFVSGVFGG